MQEDQLGWVGMANVEQGSWLCWVHGGLVWYVVLAVTHCAGSPSRIFLSASRCESSWDPGSWDPATWHPGTLGT